MSRLLARMLPDGQRLHLSDGPIDLIIQAWGDPAAVNRAYDAAVSCAGSILDDLCSELAALRAAQPGPALRGMVAKSMQRAVAPIAALGFITPMAAVAGAVADHVLQAMADAAPLARAYVNNGGDIALFLAPGEAFDAGMASVLGQRIGALHVQCGDGVRGIATSGWPGRSFSLGIADSVTVLGATAREVDAAATVIANAVDLPGHPAVRRRPACDLQPDSDLGERLVTCGVGPLSSRDRRAALALGQACSARLIRAGLVAAAAITLQGQTVIEGQTDLVQAA